MFPLDVPLEHSGAMGSSIKNIFLTKKAEDKLSFLFNWLPEMRLDPRNLPLTWQGTDTRETRTVAMDVLALILIPSISVIDFNNISTTSATIRGDLVADDDGRRHVGSIKIK